MNIALVLAGGTGTRLGEAIPKQYMEVNGKPIIAYCLEMLQTHEMVDAVQLVAGRAWHSCLCEWMSQDKGGTHADLGGKFRGFSEPGENRQLSILHGLDDIRQYASDEDIVLIHDAARPLVSKELVTACLQTCAGQDGVMPVLPMKDTVYMSEDGQMISQLLERKRLFAGQAPEAFRLKSYYEANVRLLPDAIKEINGSSEPAILAGLHVAMIPGEERNFKITTQADLHRFEELVKGR